MALMLLIGFVLIVLIDLIPIVRRHSGRTAAAFLLLFIPALTLAVLQACGIEVPSIMHLLRDVVMALGLNYKS